MTKKLSILLSVTTASLAVVAFFLAVPAIVYDTNPGEFGAPFVNILAIYWKWALAVFAVLALPTLLLPIRVARIWAAIVAVLAFYIWAHGVFQTHKFGAIDGQSWSAAVPLWQVLVEAAVIAALAGLVFLLASRQPKLVAIFSVVVATGLMAQAWPVLSKRQWVTPSTDVQMPEIARFSPVKNGLVVLMDAMVSDVFEEVVRENPEIAKNFEGFTFYPDTAGASPSTFLALPTIHSGQVYEQGMALTSFFKSSIEDHSVLTAVTRSGYDGILVNPIQNVCPKDVKCVAINSAMKSQAYNIRTESISILDAALFRIAPLGLKQRVYNNGDWIFRLMTEDERYRQAGVMHNYLLQDLAASMSTTSERPTLKFFHLLNTHEPSVYAEDCTHQKRKLERTRQNLIFQIKCSLDKFGLVIQALKKNGIFDQTAIIVLADHGNSVVPSARNTSSPNTAQLIGSANPTFAVKPVGAKGPFKMGGGEIYLGDFGATLCDLLTACKVDRGISALKEPTGRVRRFNHYRWRNEFWVASTMKVTPYEIKGPLISDSNWEKIRTVRVGEPITFGYMGVSNYLVIKGFANAEPLGTWTNGPVGTLAMIPDMKGPIQLSLDATGFVSGGPQHVEIIANDVRIGEMTLKDTEIRKYSFPIPAAEKTGEVLRIDFRISNPKSPKELGIGNDDRKLGMFLSSMTIEPL